MPVKDRVVTWFIKNIVVPRREIIDQPGFVVNTFTQKKQTTYLRELFLPEKLLELIENKIVEIYGEQGKQNLYSAGKKFGYLYSSMSNFPTIKDMTKDELIDFCYFLVRFVECTFARQADHEVNFEEKIFNIYFKDYVVCRNNGIGHFMAEGGIAGIWTYLLQDSSIEGVQIACQGKGSDRCHVFCAPETKILENSQNCFYEKEMPEYKFSNEYKVMNEIRQTTYATRSLKELLNAGFFTFAEGNLTYNGMRFFSCESHALYILENEISKLSGGEQVLFDVCFEYGKLLQESYGQKDYNKFVPDFFSAIGFGDIHILSSGDTRILVNFYPWTVFSENSRYIIFRAIMSGFISNCIGNKIEFLNFELTKRNYLTLILKK